MILCIFFIFDGSGGVDGFKLIEELKLKSCLHRLIKREESKLVILCNENYNPNEQARYKYSLHNHFNGVYVSDYQ